MKTHHLAHFAFLFSALLFLAACDDPGNVGADLVGAQGGQPDLEDVPVRDLSTAELLRPANLAPRVLAGQVEDPVFGTFVVQGYVDVTPISNADFRAGSVQRAELRLVPTYVYGDTTSQVTLALRQVSAEWNSGSLPTDTSFAVGPVIREFTFSASDTLVVVEMPASWVETNDPILRSTEFGSLFHGFRMEPVSGNAVVGFGPSGSSFFAATEEDSTLSPLGKSYQNVARNAPAVLPPDRFLIQAGAGPVASFSIPVAEQLTASAVNRAVVTFTADTLTVQANLPPHFVRPTLETLDLFGMTASGSSTLLGRGVLNDEGQFVFTSSQLAGALQDALLGRDTFEGYELRIPDPNTLSTGGGAALYYYTSLNPVLLYDVGAAEKAPTAKLTITSLD